MADFRLSQQLECAEWVAPERSQWGWSGTGNAFIPEEGGGVNELEDISWNKAMLSFWVIHTHWMGKASCFLGRRSGVMILTMDAGKSLVIKSDFSGKFCPSLPTPAEKKKISVNREAEMLNECMLAHFRLFKPCALHCVFCLECYSSCKARPWYQSCVCSCVLLSSPRQNLWPRRAWRLFFIFLIKDVILFVQYKPDLTLALKS